MKYWKELGAVLLIVTALAFAAAKFGDMSVPIVAP